MAGLLYELVHLFFHSGGFDHFVFFFFFPFFLFCVVRSDGDLLIG